MTFQDLQNTFLKRLRLNAGKVVFGQPAPNTEQDPVGPTQLKQTLNQGLQQFAQRTKDYRVCVLNTTFLSVAQQTFIPTAPLPNTPTGGPNPAVLAMYECNYTQAGSMKRNVPISGTPHFKRITGAYVGRFSSFAPIPRNAAFLFNQKRLEWWPGLSTAGDIIDVTFCPDFARTGTTLPHAQGGIMVNDADVPIIDDEFQPAILEYAIFTLCAQVNRPDDRAEAGATFEGYCEQAVDYGSAIGEGEAEQVVYDPYPALSELTLD